MAFSNNIPPVQFTCTAMSNSLWPHGLQNSRPLCPLPTPGLYKNSHPSSWWCHPTITSSVVPFAFSLQTFLSKRSFPVSQFFTSSGQMHWSFSFSISPSNEYSGWISFKMDYLDFFDSQVTHKSLLQCHSSKASVLLCSAFFIVQISHPYMTTGEIIALTRWTFVDKIVSVF